MTKVDISKEEVEKLAAYAESDYLNWDDGADAFRALSARITELEVQVELFGEDIWYVNKKARNDTLREAAIVADEWYMNVGKGTPSGEILALIDKENKL